MSRVDGWRRRLDRSFRRGRRIWWVEALILNAVTGGLLVDSAGWVGWLGFAFVIIAGLIGAALANLPSGVYSEVRLAVEGVDMLVTSPDGLHDPHFIALSDQEGGFTPLHVPSYFSWAREDGTATGVTVRVVDIR